LDRSVRKRTKGQHWGSSWWRWNPAIPQ